MKRLIILLILIVPIGWIGFEYLPPYALKHLIEKELKGEISWHSFKTKNSVYQIEGMQLILPKQLKSPNWRIRALASLLEPIEILSGTVKKDQSILNCSGLIKKGAINLSLFEEEEEVLTLKKNRIEFKGISLSYLSLIVPIEEIDGVLFGAINHMRQGELSIVDLSLGFNPDFTLHIPKAHILLFPDQNNYFIGSSVSLSHHNESFLELDLLPVNFNWGETIQLELNPHFPLCLTEKKSNTKCQIDQLRAFAKIRPYPWKFSELECELDQASLKTPIPYTLTGSLKNEIEGITFHYTIHSPSPFVGEITLNPSQFGIKGANDQLEINLINNKGVIQGKNIDFGYNPIDFSASIELSDNLMTISSFQALFEKRHFIGRGEITPKGGYYLLFQGGEGDLSFLKDLPLPNYLKEIPLEGTFTIDQGILTNDNLELSCHFSEGSLYQIHSISCDLFYHLKKKRFEIKDLTGKIDSYGIYSPLWSYQDILSFDLWVADTSQDVIRLGGKALFDESLMHITFDPFKTHFMGISPNHLSLSLKRFNEIDRLHGQILCPLLDETLQIALTYKDHQGNLSINGEKSHLSLLTDTSSSPYQITQLSIKKEPLFFMNGLGSISKDTLSCYLNFEEGALTFPKSPFFPEKHPLTGECFATLTPLSLEGIIGLIPFTCTSKKGLIAIYNDVLFQFNKQRAHIEAPLSFFSPSFGEDKITLDGTFFEKNHDLRFKGTFSLLEQNMIGDFEISSTSLTIETLDKSPKMSTLTLTDIKHFPHHLEGKGYLKFSNLFPLEKAKEYLTTQDEIKQWMTLDPKWLIPTQGELFFNIDEMGIKIHRFKDFFSEGKGIRFELYKEEIPASLTWQGDLFLPLKLKPHHIPLKWLELAYLTIEGDLFSPTLKLSLKK
ncbi:hypothetical protein N9Y92_02940 [Chlamydiales bacterium]|nr:hypothetical protein [Chlamydiales bacterium]